MRLPQFLFLILLFIVLFGSCQTANTADTPIGDSAALTAVKLELVTNQIDNPVQMVMAPDTTNRLFISDLNGKVWILKNGQIQSQPFIDISSKLEQKDTTPRIQAMFGMAFHPDYAQNKKFYICYNAPAKDTSDICTIVIAEFTASKNNADMGDLSTGKTILEIEGHSVAKDACQIAFGPDGYLYISVGDNDTPLAERQGQHLNSLLGKLLRIDVNKTPYAIPPDNPFIGVKNVRPEIWAYGFRRLWRFTYDAPTNQLLGADVGQEMQEEIDIVQKGGNYGWPVKEGDTLAVKNTTDDTTQFINPINAYSHKDGICIIGGSVYHGKNMPALAGQYVFADYNGSLFALLKNADGKWERHSLKINNPPTDPFIIFSCDTDQKNEIYLLGVINAKAGFKGAIYKLTAG